MHIFFFISPCFEYLLDGPHLEVPQCGASNEYPQHIFLWRTKKNICILFESGCVLMIMLTNYSLAGL